MSLLFSVDLIVLAVGAVILLVGLTFLALRRRNEILQDFLTPEEPHIAEEFFKKQKIVELPETAEADETDAPEEEPETTASWGTPGEEESEPST